MIAGLNEPTSNDPMEVYAYRHYEKNYVWSMLKYPVAIRDITKFEKANRISVNVYGCTNYKVSDEELPDIDVDMRTEE